MNSRDLERMLSIFWLSLFRWRCFYNIERLKNPPTPQKAPPFMLFSLTWSTSDELILIVLIGAVWILLKLASGICVSSFFFFFPFHAFCIKEGTNNTVVVL